jgi:hypothetical protein
MEGAKVCMRCRKVKPFSAFGINVQTKDGLSYGCRVCNRLTQARYRRTEEWRQWYAQYKARPDVQARWKAAAKAKGTVVSRPKCAKDRLIKQKHSLRQRIKNALAQVTRMESQIDQLDVEILRLGGTIRGPHQVENPAHTE